MTPRQRKLRAEALRWAVRVVMAEQKLQEALERMRRAGARERAASKSRRRDA